MARYIDADILLEELQRASDKEGVKADTMANAGVYDASVKYGHGQYCYINAMEIVKDAPTADVAEVVRCKDCQHYEADIIAGQIGYCNEHQKGMYEHNFCSYGKRKKVE